MQLYSYECPHDKNMLIALHGKYLFPVQSFCKRFNGGDLVAIESQSENEFIYQHLLSIPQHRDSKIVTLGRIIMPVQRGHFCTRLTCMHRKMIQW